MKCGFVYAAVCMAAACGCSSSEFDYDACGQVEATEVVVSAESNGRITEFGIMEGDRLSEGQRVGAIDSVQTFLQMKELEKRKDNAATRIVDIDVQTASQTARLRSLEKDHARFTELLSKDAGTEKQVDDVVSQIDIAKGELDALRENYGRNNDGTVEEMAIYDVQIAQKQDMLSKCRIVSPISGTVLAKFAEEGENATAGKPLFKIADMDNIFIRAYITSSQLADVDLGDRVSVFPDFGEKEMQEIEGKVIWISDEAEFTPKNIQTRDERADLVYAVKVAVKNEGNLKLGMYAYIRF